MDPCNPRRRFSSPMESPGGRPLNQLSDDSFFRDVPAGSYVGARGTALVAPSARWEPGVTARESLAHPGVSVEPAATSRDRPREPDRAQARCRGSRCPGSASANNSSEQMTLSPMTRQRMPLAESSRGPMQGTGQEMPFSRVPQGVVQARSRGTRVEHRAVPRNPRPRLSAVR